MKYFTDPVTGNLWHCSDVFNWVAVDADGTLYVYENKPVKHPPATRYHCRNCGEATVPWYWSGCAGSQDTMVIERDLYYKDWEKSLCKLTN